MPNDREELRKWLTVIARRKVAAFYQRASREQLGELPEIEAHPAPLEALSLMRWAERQAAESDAEHVDQTLEWMARESDGEKLEAIAQEAELPSARVRQRVFRLRRFMKARWALEIAAALLATAIVGWWIWGRRAETTAKQTPSPKPSVSIALPEVSPKERANDIRKHAFRTCDAGRFDECLRAFDEAARLDPAGDAAASVTEARKHAMEKLLTPEPTPLPKPPVRSPVTSSTTTPHSGTPTTASH